MLGRDLVAAAVAVALLATVLVGIGWVALAARTVAGAHRRASRRPVGLRGLDGWLSPTALADLDEALDRVALDAAAGGQPPHPAP